MDGYISGGTASNEILLSNKWNEELTHKVTRTKLKIIMLCERSHIKKISYGLIQFI